MGLEDIVDYGRLKMLVICINLSILIIYKNASSLINTWSDITYILYFSKIIFK